MPIPGLDHDKCLTRNRLAARRRDFTAAPIRFLLDEDFAGNAGTGIGKIAPLCSDEAALGRINASRPGQDPLTKDDIHIHWVEAANGNFIGDRYMFLGTQTLKNIARDADAGFAFMNSHRTGGFSTESELPFGRTFIGRYEKGDADDPGSERTLLGFYMLQGIHPNGESGPSTDDLHRMIDGGTLFDVSVGLYGGVEYCDVCGEDLNACDEEGWLCPHVPGTTYRMDETQVQAQKDRGVPGGMATSTLDESRCGEVSGVYDGAVPGAGFRKTLSLARSGALDTTASAQAAQAYSGLLSAKESSTLHRLSKGDTDTMDEKGLLAAIREGFTSLGKDLKDLVGLGQTPPATPPAPPAVPAEFTAKINEQNTKLSEQNEQLAQANAKIEELGKQADADKKAGQHKEDLGWIEGQVKAFKISPAAAEHFKTLAETNPVALAALKPGIEANPVITALAPDPKAADTSVAGTALAGGSDAATPQARLEQLTKKHMAENPGTSYGDAFGMVCSQNKDLAAAYRNAASA